MENRKNVEIYTDGACLGNPGDGGIGVILMYKDVQKEISSGYPDTTNNKMELLAVIEGLKMLKEPCKVSLYTDSSYVVNSIEKGWVYGWQKKGWMRNSKEEAKNKELWQELLELLKIHDVSFIWIKGHAGNPFNERCDILAKQGAYSIKSQNN